MPLDERPLAPHHGPPGAGRGRDSPRSRASTPRSTRSCGRSTCSWATRRSATSSAARRAAASCSKDLPAPARPISPRRWRSRPACRSCSSRRRRSSRCGSGMTAYRIRSFFKALRKAARKEGGAIGFIEEIDAIGMSRDGACPTPRPNPTPARSLGRRTSAWASSGGMVNELLIQMQSFDQPPLRDRMRAKMMGWINGYLPNDRQLTAGQVRVQQHPADRRHEPRGLPRRGAAATRTLRPAPVLRRADEAGRARS